MIISRWGVGFDVVDLEACNNAGILLTIAPREGVRTPVAEGILAFILALTKGVLTRDNLVRSGLWLSKANFPAYDLSSLTLGSIGVGNIGSELFRLAASLGFQRFLATDPYVKPTQVARLHVELVDLPTLLTQADILCINCPLTTETHGMIDKQALSLMKKTAFLINTSRGPIIDETDLAEALEQERLAGAALDVFDLEPVESQNPLLQRKDVILSPHSIAFTHGLIRHNTLYACMNILAVFKGELPTTIVNRNVLSNPQLLNKLQALQKRFKQE
jgi:phosphoglycerate dehydrogenase-like enzyme